jgi:hypothetical protein
LEENGGDGGNGSEDLWVDKETGRNLSTAQPAEANTLSTEESAAQGGFTAPEVLALALLALLALVGLGSIMLILAIV